MPHLKELDKKYKDRGLKLLAVSNEDEGKIGPFVTERQIEYTVVRYKKIAEDYGLKGWPSAWVLDGEGKVLWAKHFVNEITDDQWNQWLEALAPTKVGKPLSRELGGAAKAFDKGEIGKAMAELKKVADGATDEALKADCDYLAGLCARHVTLFENKIKAAGSDMVAKVKAMEEAAAKFKGSELGAKWEADAKELKKSKDYEAFEALAKLKPQLDDLKPATARKKLEAIARKYPDTEAGKEAAALAKQYGK